MSLIPKPIVLIILDGWGYSENIEYNAIAAAHTPNWDRLWSQCPHTLINASESAVGLPTRQMGNSEVGHLNIGAGRVVYQEFTRINRAIATGTFFSNATLTDAIDLAKVTDRAVHVMGLLSPGGVHSHEDQIYAMMEMAGKRGVDKTYLHAFTDGRDTPPKSALSSIEKMEEKLQALGKGRFASIIGRYYAMDRDHRWPRIQTAYDLISQGKAPFQVFRAREAIEQAYGRGETDEFIQATAIIDASGQPVQIKDGDVMIMMNFRSDRARQIARPFIEPDFGGFERDKVLRLGRFVSLTEYQSEFNIPVAFAPERLSNVLGAYLSRLGKRQLRLAETEKYAHVTFFFNGGVEAPFEGEDRILVPSPTDVATYNLKPAMSAHSVTDELIKGIRSEKYDVIICNFANPDMVGHTGDFDATVEAIETLDSCLGRILPALNEAGGELLITADHGNAERMYDVETGQRHTAHSINPVPLIYKGRIATIAASGALEDVAPTLLRLLDLEIPSEMTGKPLVKLDCGA
ncbi:MAG TPA: 2,3-bisphosphoglycerate-independent phosphoglycerate mutase [Acidiferrobacteraceae bacterium]|nr:2,3-bisphosphoglycerate-independent phosphoglycerate mutase [Acidiferrobacteraceae bacterium]